MVDIVDLNKDFNQSVTFGQSMSLFAGLILFACPFGAPNKLFVIFLVLATLSHKNFKLFFISLIKGTLSLNV